MSCQHVIFYLEVLSVCGMWFRSVCGDAVDRLGPDAPPSRTTVFTPKNPLIRVRRAPGEKRRASDYHTAHPVGFVVHIFGRVVQYYCTFARIRMERSSQGAPEAICASTEVTSDNENACSGDAFANRPPSSSAHQHLFSCSQGKNSNANDHTRLTMGNTSDHTPPTRAPVAGGVVVDGARWPSIATGAASGHRNNPFYSALSTTDVSNAMLPVPASCGGCTGGGGGPGGVGDGARISFLPFSSSTLASGSACDSAFDSPSKPNRSSQEGIIGSSPWGTAGCPSSGGGCGDEGSRCGGDDAGGINNNNNNNHSNSSANCTSVADTEKAFHSPSRSRRARAGDGSEADGEGGANVPSSPQSPFHLFAGTELSPISNKLAASRPLPFPRAMKEENDNESNNAQAGDIINRGSAKRRALDVPAVEARCFDIDGGKGGNGEEVDHERGSAVGEPVVRLQVGRWKGLSASGVGDGNSDHVGDCSGGGREAVSGLSESGSRSGSEHLLYDAQQRSPSPELISTFLSPPTLPGDAMEVCDARDASSATAAGGGNRSDGDGGGGESGAGQPEEDPGVRG